MRSGFSSLAVGAVAATVLLSGCSISLTAQIPEVAGSEIAVAVEDNLEAAVGTRPEVECGDDPVQLEVGTSITCLLVDPDTGLEFDTVVTIKSVTGTEFEVGVEVADSPNNPPDPTVDPASPSVSGADIAALVVVAFTPSLPAPPNVSCPDPTVDIFVGNVTYCSFEDENGVHDVQVTITEYDPDSAQYSIKAEAINE